MADQPPAYTAEPATVADMPPTYTAQPAHVPVAPVVQVAPTATVVYTTTTVGAPSGALGLGPQMWTCQYCNATAQTRVQYKNGTLSLAAAGIMCFVGCWPCCLVPLVMDSMHDCHHYCGNCGQFVGVRPR